MDLDPSSIPIQSGRQILPERYRLLRLDRTALDQFLKDAPSERARGQGTGERGPAHLELNLPLPNGRIGRFEVVRSPVMSPDLAARYPQIQTYAGRSSDVPTAVIRFDLTQHGFHAMILSSGPTVFIEPYARYKPDEAQERSGPNAGPRSGERHDGGAGDAYICFYKTDMASAAPEIGLTCEAIDEDGMQSLIEDLIAQGFGQGGSGEELRTYRTAIAATGEYTRFHGGTVADGLAAIVEGLNRVNGLFERDVAIRMELVPNNDSIIYTDGETDPYTNDDGPAMLEENQVNVDAVIGSENYDVGHVFSTRGGGIAHIGVACRESLKARGVSGLGVPEGDVFLTDFVAHEMGHQFGAFHAFNGNAGSCATHRHPTAAYEPGSGSTIMAYAGFCQEQNLQLDNDDYFHARSFELIRAYTIAGSGSACSIVTLTGNNSPVVDAGAGGLVLPIGTPFRLDGSATDPDGDALTYCWEEFDLGPQGPPDSPVGNAPIFRSFNPSNVTWRVFPKMADILENTHTLGEILPSYSRDLRFRLTARDNRVLGGGSAWDAVSFTVSDQAGPFDVTGLDVPTIWLGNTIETITWSVANTNAAPVHCEQVDILFSDDFGATFEHVLAASVANDGAHDVVVPNVPVIGGGRLMVRAADHIFFNVNDAFISIQPQTATVDEGSDLLLGLTVDPNPSHGEAQVRFALQRESEIKISIVDATGREVATLAKERLGPGAHEFPWSGMNAKDVAVPSGVYFVRLSLNGKTQSTRLIHLE